MNIPSHMLMWIICLIVISGCGSSENHQQKDSGESARSDTVSMNNDSLPPPPKPGPAPGQARIRGKITDIRKAGNREDLAIVTFHLTGIDAYGPSTPPLAAPSSLRVQARISVIKQEKISSGKSVTAVISYRQSVLRGSGLPQWTLVTLD